MSIEHHLPVFISPKNTYAWNSLGNASLGLLFLNFQLILTEMRIRFVKQDRPYYITYIMEPQLKQRQVD